MNRSILIAGLAVSAAVFAAPLAAAAGTGFAGAYGPASATISTADTGFIDTSNAPDSITLVGGSSGDFLGSDQLYAVTISANSVLSFDWAWSTEDCCGAFFDPFGYRLNGGDFVSIIDQSAGGDADISQIGSFSLAVHAGDVFAFDQNSVDNFGGAGTTVVSNFDVEARTGAVPEPAAWGLMIVGFAGLGAALRARRPAAVPQA